jgi:hypothetical protein
LICIATFHWKFDSLKRDSMQQKVLKGPYVLFDIFDLCFIFSLRIWKKREQYAAKSFKGTVHFGFWQFWFVLRIFLWKSGSLFLWPKIIVWERK